MATLNVVKPFTLQMDPPVIGEEPDLAKDPSGQTMKKVYGTPDKYRFVPGIYENIDDEVASHWYTQAHLAGYEPPPPAPGTHQFAQEALLAAQGVRMMQPVQQQGQTPAPLPDDVKVMQRSGEVTEGAHYFAGSPVEDKPLPGTAVDNTVKPPGEPQTQRSDAAMLGTKAPTRHHR